MDVERTMDLKNEEDGSLHIAHNTESSSSRQSSRESRVFSLVEWKGDHDIAWNVDRWKSELLFSLTMTFGSYSEQCL